MKLTDCTTYPDGFCMPLPPSFLPSLCHGCCLSGIQEYLSTDGDEDVAGTEMALSLEGRKTQDEERSSTSLQFWVDMGKKMNRGSDFE